MFQTLLGKGKNIAMLISISRPSLLLQRTEGHDGVPSIVTDAGLAAGAGAASRRGLVINQRSVLYKLFYITLVHRPPAPAD